MGEISETLKRIQETKNVIGTMVINHDGIAIKSSIDTSVTAQVLLGMPYNVVMVYTENFGALQKSLPC